MTPEIARDILPLVNDGCHHDTLLRYLDYRINGLRSKLEIPGDHNALLSVQGQIKELRKMKSIQAEARGVLENDRRDV